MYTNQISLSDSEDDNQYEATGNPIQPYQFNESQDVESPGILWVSKIQQGINWPSLQFSD